MTVEPPVVAPVMPYEAIPSTSVALKVPLWLLSVSLAAVSVRLIIGPVNAGAAAFSTASSRLIVTFVADETFPNTSVAVTPNVNRFGAVS